jgi:hypothetical protein
LESLALTIEITKKVLSKVGRATHTQDTNPQHTHAHKPRLELET